MKKWTDVDVRNYMTAHGGREVHRSWRDNMILQQREIEDKRMNWDTLSEQDKLLDRQIAFDIVRDFLAWCGAYSPARD